MLVVVGIIALLIGILIPTALAVRQRAYIDRCAENLRQMGHAMVSYRADHGGQLPQAQYVPGAPLTFGSAGPQANDVTAALFVLRKSQDLPAGVFVCPFTDQELYQPDADEIRPDQANFTDYRVNLGYSIANLYPSNELVERGFGPYTSERSDYPLMADLNPGLPQGVEPVTAESTSDALRAQNSANHGRYGQNVLMADGSVRWSATPLVGIDGDHIYVNQAGNPTGMPADVKDTVMSPVAPPTIRVTEPSAAAEQISYGS